MGWFADGSLPLDGQDPDLLVMAQVGWIFSEPLHGRLRTLQLLDDLANSLQGDPFGIRTAVE